MYLFWTIMSLITSTTSQTHRLISCMVRVPRLVTLGFHFPSRRLIINRWFIGNCINNCRFLQKKRKEKGRTKQKCRIYYSLGKCLYRLLFMKNRNIIENSDVFKNYPPHNLPGLSMLLFKK